MKSKLIVIILCFLSWRVPVCTAPLENVPIKLYQPDGTEILCLTSGDEFYHWLHDSLGNIVIKDSISGYYCYCVEGTDSLVAVRNNIIQNHRYMKNASVFSNERDKMIRMYNQIENSSYEFIPNRDSATRIINNLVIFISFADQADYTNETISALSTMFVDSAINANSLKNYYWESSYHQLKVNSTFYPLGTLSYSYQDIYPRAYYCPYSADNPIGYSLNGNARKHREDSLLVRAITSIQAQIPSSLNLDSDNNGYVDNICFVVKGGTTAWNTLLWPHKWNLKRYILINGKRVNVYNFQLSDYILSHGVGVLCHEFGHTLGLPDLYHYNPDSTGYKWKPVGQWDVMASNGYYPQQMSGYMKHKYLHWINEIPEIHRSGRFSLSTISSSPQCYKVSFDGSSEFLYLEYRNNTYLQDTSIPNSGLVIYRINPIKNGNSAAYNGGGKEDEIYVYRPNGTFTSDGNLSIAPLTIELGATSFNATTNPQEFLSNGSLGNIYISNVSGCGPTISFDVKICSTDNITYDNTSVIPSYTNAEIITTMGDIIINNDSTIFEASESVILNGGFSIPLGKIFTAEIKPCE